MEASGGMAYSWMALLAVVNGHDYLVLSFEAVHGTSGCACANFTLVAAIHHMYHAEASASGSGGTKLVTWILY